MRCRVKNTLQAAAIAFCAFTQDLPRAKLPGKYAEKQNCLYPFYQDDRKIYNMRFKGFNKSKIYP